MQPPASSCTARGFALIEVLVSLFVVSLGILALSGVMQASNRYGKTSELRSTATLLANDIADHVRANGAGAATGGYDLARAYPGPAPREPDQASCELAHDAPCTPQQLAALDLYRWQQRLLATLPNGSGFVRYNAPGADARASVDVWVGWTDPAVNGARRNERPAGECPAGFDVAANHAVRCVYLQVGL